MPILETIGTFIGIRFLGKVTDKTLDFGFLKINQPDYQKYKSCLNPPLKMAFKKTMYYFFKESASYNVCEQIWVDLSRLDSTEINLIFGNDNITYDYFYKVDPFEYTKEHLKSYIKIKYGREFENDIYEDWVKKFEQEYEYAFNEYCSRDSVYFQQFMKDVRNSCSC